MPLYGHACRPSIKDLSWIVPEANQPVQAPGGLKYMKLCGIHQTLTKKYDECLFGNLKIDWKLQKVTQAIYFGLCNQLANQKVD